MLQKVPGEGNDRKGTLTLTREEQRVEDKEALVAPETRDNETFHANSMNFNLTQ